MLSNQIPRDEGDPPEIRARPTLRLARHVGKRGSEAKRAFMRNLDRYDYSALA